MHGHMNVKLVGIYIKLVGIYINGRITVDICVWITRTQMVALCQYTYTYAYLYSPVEMWWHTVTHARGSRGETGEWCV
jgi:hypothetical protein